MSDENTKQKVKETKLISSPIDSQNATGLARRWVKVLNYSIKASPGPRTRAIAKGTKIRSPSKHCDDVSFNRFIT